MSDTTLDCRGLACPQPVLRCKAHIDAAAPNSPAALAVLVDNEASKENVTRFLQSRGFTVTAEETQPGLWRVAGAAPAAGTALRGEDDPALLACPAATPAADPSGPRKIVVFLSAQGIGHGDDGLGEKLMVNFLATLPELGTELWRIILVNGAVTMAVAGSPVLDKLKALEQAGATILVCGTCLDHFGILAQKAVGQTTNMLDVVTSLQLADKVLSP